MSLPAHGIDSERAVPQLCLRCAVDTHLRLHPVYWVMRESDRDRPDDHSTSIDDNNHVRFNQANDADDASFDNEDSAGSAEESPTNEDALDAPKATPIVPEQISPENAAFVVLGVALTVVVILTAI